MNILKRIEIVSTIIFHGLNRSELVSKWINNFYLKEFFRISDNTVFLRKIRSLLNLSPLLTK